MKKDMDLARRIRGDRNHDFRDLQPKSGDEVFLALPHVSRANTDAMQMLQRQVHAMEWEALPDSLLLELLNLQRSETYALTQPKTSCIWAVLRLLQVWEESDIGFLIYDFCQDHTACNFWVDSIAR